MKLKTLIRFPKFAKNFKIHFNSLESLLTLFMQNTIASQKIMLQLLENYAAIKWKCLHHSNLKYK